MVCVVSYFYRLIVKMYSKQCKLKIIKKEILKIYRIRDKKLDMKRILIILKVCLKLAQTGGKLSHKI